MKGSPIYYLDIELAWIEANRELPRAELHALFVARFERTDISMTNLNALCKRRGWLTGRSGRYEPGRTPENKGKKMPYHPNSAATRFKAGQLSGAARARQKPIGTERISKDGYLERKIHNDLPLQSRWRAIHLIRWEERNGPVPAGHALKCLDGDKTNCDPSNWVAVARSMLPRLAGAKTGTPYDTAPAELKPTIMAIAKLEDAARQTRRRQA